MDALAQFLLVAALVEAVVQGIKPIYEKQEGKAWSIDPIIALVLSELVCISFSIDLFSAVGLETDIPYVGSVLTAIPFSRGANVVHDLIEMVRGAYLNIKA